MLLKSRVFFILALWVVLGGMAVDKCSAQSGQWVPADSTGTPYAGQSSFSIYDCAHVVSGGTSVYGDPPFEIPSTWQYYGPEAGALPTAGGYTGVDAWLVGQGLPYSVYLNATDTITGTPF